MLPRIVVWREPRMHKRRAGRPGKAALWGERTGSERMCTKESRPTADLPRPGTSFVLRGFLGFPPLILSSDQPWRWCFSLVGVVFGIVWNGVVGRPKRRDPEARGRLYSLG